MGCNFVTMQLCCAYCRNIKCSHQWVTAYIERSLLVSNTESTSVTKNIFIRDKLFRHKYVMLQIMTPPKYQRKVAHVSKIVQLVDGGFMERIYRAGLPRQKDEYTLDKAAASQRQRQQQTLFPCVHLNTPLGSSSGTSRTKVRKSKNIFLTR